MKRKMMLVAVLAALLMVSVGFIQPVAASKMGDLKTESSMNAYTEFKKKILPTPISDIVLALLGALVGFLSFLLVRFITPIIDKWLSEHRNPSV